MNGRRSELTGINGAGDKDSPTARRGAPRRAARRTARR